MCSLHEAEAYALKDILSPPSAGTNYVIPPGGVKLFFISSALGFCDTGAVLAGIVVANAERVRCTKDVAYGGQN